MKEIIQAIPETLVYEMTGGEPIYYKGYMDYLNGNKQIEELMGSSYIQSLIITNLVVFLATKLPKSYQVLTNEVGIQFSKNSWRAADIAIIEKSKLTEDDKVNKYIRKAPKIVIEIDTKANLDEVKDVFGYFHKKTDELLKFGVEKVVWIFSDSRKIMIATKDENWEIQDWNKSLFIMDVLEINLESLLED